MNLIYKPTGRALEYAPLACNVYRGCDHGCVYCYAPGTTRRTRADFQHSTARPGNFLRRLASEAAEREKSGVAGDWPVLLSFTCDPYQHVDERLRHTRRVITILKSTGHTVEILTKGGLRALRDLDLLDERDALAATLTFTPSSGLSQAYEPNAAPPAERIEMLRAAHDLGIRTWASLEPVLNTEQAFNLIERTAPFVDLFKIGKLNRQGSFDPVMRHALNDIERTTNWSQFALDAVALCQALGCPYYVKDSLATYLPPTVARAQGWWPSWLPRHHAQPI